MPMEINIIRLCWAIRSGWLRTSEPLIMPMGQKSRWERMDNGVTLILIDMLLLGMKRLLNSGAICIIGRR